MSRINVYRTNSFLSRFFIVSGGILAIFGIFLLIRAMVSGFNTKFPSGDWNSVMFTIQGLLFIIMGAGNLHTRKYFIEWDDNEIRFLLPDTRRTEVIRLTDIIAVNSRLFEIEFILPEKTRILDLSNMQFEDLKLIKERFEIFKTVK